MKRPRFSRQTVLDEINGRLRAAEMAYQAAAGRPLDHGNGYAQVPPGNDAASRAYGMFTALASLRVELA